MFTRWILAGFATGTLFTTVGCHGRWLRRDRAPESVAPRERTRTPSPTGPGIYLDDTVPTPRGGGDITPPPVIPDSRGSFRIDPYKPTNPWDPAPSRSLFGEAPAPAPRSNGPELLLPESNGSGPPSTIDIPSARKPGLQGFLGEPIRSAESLAPAAVPNRTERPALLNDPVSRAPIGLPGYAAVPGRAGVAAGGKPTLDGFDWLKANGYRTVVYLHSPGSDTTAARDLATARGLTFTPIAVAPSSLRKSYHAFAAVVEDRAARPLYVADADGQRAGALWYLLFRTADLQGDDVARVKAAPLGLGDATTESQKQFWIAIQEFLANR